MKRIQFLLIVSVLSLLLSACQTATPIPPTATTAPTAIPATHTPQPSATVAPSATRVPPTATATLAPTATATPTLTPTAVFAGFRILYSDYQKWGLMLAFYIPGVKQPYDLQVNKVKYSCTLQPNLPDQMFCMGPEFPQNRKVELAFYAPNATTTPVFKTDYVIAPIKTPTPEGYIPPGDANCPVRGINASCETELRGETWPGGPCIVSTCVDSCGYWYSIDTCE